MLASLLDGWTLNQTWLIWFQGLKHCVLGWLWLIYGFERTKWSWKKSVDKWSWKKNSGLRIKLSWKKSPHKWLWKKIEVLFFWSNLPVRCQFAQITSEVYAFLPKHHTLKPFFFNSYPRLCCLLADYLLQDMNMILCYSQKMSCSSTMMMWNLWINSAYQ